MMGDTTTKIIDTVDSHNSKDGIDTFFFEISMFSIPDRVLLIFNITRSSSLSSLPWSPATNVNVLLFRNQNLQTN